MDPSNAPRERSMKPQQESEPPAPEITPERIRARAYEIYEARGGAAGDAISDWLQAERELRLTVERRSPEIEDRAGTRRADAGRRDRLMAAARLRLAASN